MALSNRERVGRVLESLTIGLASFVLREYRMTYRKNWTREIQSALSTTAYTMPHEALTDVKVLVESLDAHSILSLMIRNWHDVFHQKLGHSGKNYASELYNARNDWAHQKAFTNDEAYRVADTASRLLKMVSAG
jgi:hypothetical protein